MTHPQPAHWALRAITVGCVASLAACSGPSTLVSASKVDYRTEAVKVTELDVPPDLTQLARDSRYKPQSGVVSASTVAERSPGSAPTAAPAAASVALNSIDGTRIERQGNQRWLVTNRSPEQLWPVLQSLWQENGFVLAIDNAAAGVMETSWAENRAKLPQDFIRRSLGRLSEKLYDTGTRDQFRTRVERTVAGTEVYILHRGAVEEFTGSNKESTAWRAAPNDPQLEAEFLSRLLVKLGGKDTTTARTAVETAPERPAASAAVVAAPARSEAISLEMNENFERAYRRVGLSLDRAGFTVEDRDRSAGLYFVRYVPGVPGAEEPGFLARLFSSKDAQTPVRYRVLVKGSSEGKSLVTVQNSQGQPETGDVAKRIISLISNDLR